MSPLVLRDLLPVDPRDGGVVGGSEADGHRLGPPPLGGSEEAALVPRPPDKVPDGPEKRFDIR